MGSPAVRVVDEAEGRMPEIAIEVITAALPVEIAGTVLNVARVRGQLGETNLSQQCKHFRFWDPVSTSKNTFLNTNKRTPILGASATKYAFHQNKLVNQAN